MSSEQTLGVGLAESPVVARYRGFTTFLLLASLLAGAATVLGDAPMAARIAAAILTAATWLAGAGVGIGKRTTRLPWVALLAVAGLVIFVLYAQPRAPWSPRDLHVATLLTYGAIAVAATLTAVGLLGQGKALLVTFSTAVVLMGAELFIAPPPPNVAPVWELNTVAGPDVEVRYAPHSTARTFYPDNPRGYFEQTNPLKETWSLETHPGGEARLDTGSSEDAAMRVTLMQIGTEVWNVKLQQIGFHVTGGNAYVLKFRAKADAPRRGSCAVGQNHDPWSMLGLYNIIDLTAEWKNFECPFVATANDANARIYFDLASSLVPVEISDVVLHNKTTGKDEVPSTPATRYFVSYQFNSLGFRGPDPVVPRPAGTFRILALGDSFALGEGVREKDTFEAQLQARLNGADPEHKSGTTYEVVNAGVSGYATRQELRSYELFSSKYDPQLVLLTMVFNDDISFPEEVRRGLFVTTENPGGLKNLWNRTHQSTRTYDYSDSIRALKELNDSTRQHGAKLAVVLFQNVRNFPAWDHLTTEVKNALAGTGVPVLNIKDALFADGRTDADLAVHRIDGHPNELAHRIAADAIGQFLKTEHLVP